MDILYISFNSETADAFRVPLESFIVCFVGQWVKSNEVSNFVFVKSSENDHEEPSFVVPKTALEHFSPRISCFNDLPHMIRQCTLPCVLLNHRHLCLTGLCVVLRHILMISRSETGRKLLGFRRSCLMSCAEVSVWTKFCEIDLLRSTKEFLLNGTKDGTIEIPIDVSRYEAHLSQPLKTHNIGKKQNDIVKELRRMTVKNKTEKRDAIETNSFTLEHEYAEDVVMTLADVVIFVNIRLIFNRTLSSLRSECIPNLKRVSDWYRRMESDDDVSTAATRCGLTLSNGTEHDDECRPTITVPSVSFESLYIRDPSRYNPTPRMYTKQIEVEAVFRRLKNSSIEPKKSEIPSFVQTVVNWSDLPEAVHPKFGDLPMSRLERKCQQLENMANVICGIAKDGDTIVDFCSGGGHLGILLAHLLPKCNVLMIENKESSVSRAVVRAKTLANATVYQCNLDYFMGSFDIGVALHACGVATDLVLQRCVKIGASFVVCPCCYGGVRNTHILSYPRSETFRSLGITSEEYYFLGHSADQTHENGHKEEQGKFCMSLVDTDRLCEAEAAGYEVLLFKMNPPKCTPKNNILLGIKKLS